MEDESSARPDQIVHEAETTRSWETGETTPTDLEAVGNLFDEVLTGKGSVEDACMSQELTRIIERLDVKKQSIQASRTTKLWLQFMKMMDILRMLLTGERMGIWELQIQGMYDMMPYLAASGHNLYPKCIHVYMQQMHKLHEPIQGCPDTSTNDSTLYADQIGSGQDFPLILSLSKSSCGA